VHPRLRTGRPVDLHLEHEFFFNPDGTGKVKVKWTGPLQTADVDPMAFMREEVARGTGIEAWADLRCAPNGEQLVFEGTAYFRNVSELRFHCQGVHVGSVDFATATDEAGAFTLVGRVDAKPETPVTDEAALPEAMVQAREQLAAGREFLEGMFGGLRCSVLLHLPGAIGTVKNAKKVDARTASSEMAGADLLAILDRLATDDGLMAEMLKRGGGPEAVSSLLGDKGPVQIATQGKTKALFDFDAEATAAAAAFEAFRASLNIPAGPERTAPAQNARIAAVKLVREADGERELNPMGQNFASYSFVVVADLPGPALKAEEGMLEAFTTDEGVDLLPEGEWDRKCHFPKLTNDGKTVLCEMDVKFPDGEPTGIREIRGVVRVQVSTAAEEVDLGFAELAAGAEGAQLGARLERCETGEDGRTSIELRLGVAMERVQAVALVDENGSAAELNRGGYSSSGDECTLTLDSDAALQPGMKLKARVMTELKYYDVPFGVENVDLLGRPRG
jgi:hypothetical protein